MKLLALTKALALVALVSVIAMLPARAADVAVDGNLKMLCGTVTGSAAAATLANKCGVVTTESLTTAAGALYTETITATGKIAAADLCFASVAAGGTGTPAVTRVTPAADSLVIIVQNVHASAAFNAALVISYMCVRP